MHDSYDDNVVSIDSQDIINMMKGAKEIGVFASKDRTPSKVLRKLFAEAKDLTRFTKLMISIRGPVETDVNKCKYIVEYIASQADKNTTIIWGASIHKSNNLQVFLIGVAD